VLGDWFGLRPAMTTVFLTIAYILSISIWARPLIRNETWSMRKALGQRDALTQDNA